MSTITSSNSSVVATGADTFRGHLASWRRWGARALAALLVTALFLFGLIAIESGLSNYLNAGDTSVAVAREAARIAADRGDPVVAQGLDAGVRYLTLNMLAWLNSERFAYGEHSLIETLVHYATMPTLNSRILALHNVLGGFCMLFGAIQFWPAMRRNYPRWHRGFGMSYVVAGQVAMIAAASYLLLTPVDKIYDQMTFWALLWAMAIGVSVTLWLAMYHLWRGEIAQHQGYMCLNYGLLLTAPLLRLAWVGMGWLNPAARQIEGAFAAHAILLPLSLLCGYGLFVVNRWSQPERTVLPSRQTGHLSPSGRVPARLVALVLLAAVGVLAQQMVLVPGLAALPQARVWMPDGLLALDQQVLVAQPALRLLFTAASALGMLVGAWCLWGWAPRAPGQQRWGYPLTWVLASAGAVTAAVQLVWAVGLGLPSFETLTGGTLWMLGGLVTLGFSALLAWASWRGLPGWTDEWAWFVLTCLVAAPSLYLWLPVVAAFEPAAAFVQAGHVYRTAGLLQWGLLVVPFIGAIHSGFTGAKRAR